MFVLFNPTIMSLQFSSYITTLIIAILSQVPWHRPVVATAGKTEVEG